MGRHHPYSLFASQPGRSVNRKFAIAL
jgi:hypothetical protein